MGNGADKRLHGEWVSDGARAKVSIRPEELKVRCELVQMLGWALE